MDVLRNVRYPGFTRDLVSFGVVKDVSVAGTDVSVRIEIGPGNPAVVGAIDRDVRNALGDLKGVGRVEVRVEAAPPPRSGATGAAGLEESVLPGVRHMLAVASGKGGVGKSTVAVNLAVALAERGGRVGLLDADIYGPSIPLMMGTSDRPSLDETGRRIRPFEKFGVRFMSLGFLLEKDSAVIWRGPMVMKAVEQLLRDVAWGELDVLVVDLPPGTGDAQLTLAQKAQLHGAVIVTTPQDVALEDATKGVAMFRKVGVPVLGILENMSYFLCTHCGQRTEIFGHGGGRAEAERLGVPFLGEVPLDPSIRQGGDAGNPVAAPGSDSPARDAFLRLADRVLESVPRPENDPSVETRSHRGAMNWIRSAWGSGDREDGPS
jgi:ATP-binding protein involved in chromosome partitioning